MDEPRHRDVRFLPRGIVRFGNRSFDRMAMALVRLKITPNTLTVAGLLAGAAGGAFLAFGRPSPAFIAILLCGIFDVVDGRVAVRTNAETRFGALLDSTLDRYSEFFLYAGLAYHFQGRWPSWLAWLAFLGSAMVSYTRARAEGLGLDCRIGLMQRRERFLILGTGVLAGVLVPVFDAAMMIALGLIAFLANITAVQRILYVRRADRSNSRKG
jgi:phosphatidylglycerophosphate synthase